MSGISPVVTCTEIGKSFFLRLRDLPLGAEGKSRNLRKRLADLCTYISNITYLSSECPSLCDGFAVCAEEEGQRRLVRRGVTERGQVRVIVAWRNSTDILQLKSSPRLRDSPLGVGASHAT